jgi:CHAT domain-containing protein
MKEFALSILHRLPLVLAASLLSSHLASAAEPPTRLRALENFMNSTTEAVPENAGMLTLSTEQLGRSIKLETSISGVISPAFASAEYAKVVRDFEARERDGDQADPYSVSIYCLALQNIGRWGKAQSCIERNELLLKERVERGGESCLPIFHVCIGTALASSTYHLARARQAQAIGEYQGAIAYARTSAEAAEQTGFFNRGGLSWAQSQYALALALGGRHDEALAAARKTLDDLASTSSLARSGVADDVLFNLASAYLTLGDGPAAWAVAQRIGTETALTDTLKVTGAVAAISLAPLGGTALFGALVSAETLRWGVEMGEMWERGAELRRAFIMARAAYAAGELATAKPLFEQLAQSPLVQAMAEIYPAVLESLGRIAQAEGKQDRAEAHYWEAIDIIETSRASFREEAGRMGFVQDKQGLFLELVDLLVATNRPEAAFRVAERAKARALVELLASRGTPLPVAASLADQIREMDAAEKLVSGFNPAVTGDALSKTRTLLIKQRAALAQAAPQAAALLGANAPPTAELLSALQETERLLLYFGAGERWFAFVASRQGVIARRLAPSQLASQVEQYREAIAAPSDASTHRQLGTALYAALLAPLEDVLDGETLTIVPHGPLHYLPFSALPTGEQAYLLDRYVIRLLPSASLLRLLRTPKGGGIMLALGNPDLKDASLDLPGAQHEVESIAKSWPQTVMRLRAAASEALVKRDAERYLLLHFASHGVFDGVRPLASGLLLSAGDGEDGRLTVGELFGLRLDADLVVLSACETGLGKLRGGDDLIGLSRGFFYAGASSIIGSLWQVSDEATALLMTSFYISLEKRPLAAALRDAQLEVRKSEYSHPFYWAPFQLTGWSGAT